MRERVPSLLRRVFTQLCRARARARVRTHAMTPVCSGDYHAGNMLYRKSGGATGQRLVIVDWSECGPWEPAVDLAQTIISDVRPEVWRGKDQALVRSYYDRLIRNGVDAEKYDWERCWDDYRRTGIEKWVFILCILASYPMPRVGLAYFVSQVEAFLGAHDAWEGYTIKQVIPIV